MMRAVNLAEKLASFDERWSPRVVAELNGQQVKLVKCEGEHVWHDHAGEDEMFLVLSGRLRICFRDREVLLGPGELCVVPRGVEHRPLAEGPVELLLFEPASTRSTGAVDHPYSVEPDDLPRI